MYEEHGGEYYGSSCCGTKQVECVHPGYLPVVGKEIEANENPSEKKNREKSGIIEEDECDLVFPQHLTLQLQGVERIYP